MVKDSFRGRNKLDNRGQKEVPTITLYCPKDLLRGSIGYSIESRLKHTLQATSLA